MPRPKKYQSIQIDTTEPGANVYLHCEPTEVERNLTGMVQNERIRPDGAGRSAEDQRHAPPSESIYQGPRGLAVKILSRIDRSDSYLDKLVDAAIRNNQLDNRDARLLNEIAHGVLRHRERIDWVLTGFYHGEYPKCLPPIKNAMRVALYQILFLDRVPWSAAVNESVDLVKRFKGERSAGKVNGVLRNVIRKIDAITWPEEDEIPVHYFSTMGSHPKWLVRRWLERFGIEETEELLKANNERPPITFSVISRDRTTEEIFQELEDLGAAPERSRLLERSLRVSRMPDIGSLEMIRRGDVIVQDEGAGLAALLSGATEGSRVIDLCAAPGGKSIVVASRVGPDGHVVALDKYPAKVEALAATVERTGLSDTISATVGDARTFEHAPVDIVLLDAPCSGIGVLRRKPEIKWKREMKDVRELALLQLELIEAAARLVRPGGSLVYTTCTTEPEENREVVELFLSSATQFSLVPANEFLPADAVNAGVVDEDGYLQTLPHRHGTDGTFGAHLRRRA